MKEQTRTFFNRELSWLEFNRRVLAEAADERVPLLERVKFLSITSSNLDEFLMVRAGAIRQLIDSGVREPSRDGMTPKQQLKAIRRRVATLLGDMYAALGELLPRLGGAGIHIERADVLSKSERNALADEFQARIAPVLTPLAFDPGHPFPFLTSGALNLAVTLSSGSETHTAFIKVPRLLPRFISIPEADQRFLPVEDLIALHAGWFFPGLEIRAVVPFRVIRNGDILLDRSEVEDLLESVETELRRRERNDVIWMEVAAAAGDDVLTLLERELDVSRNDIFLTPDVLKLSDLIDIYSRVGAPGLRDEPFSPRLPPDLAGQAEIFPIVRERDVLLHRPYDSYAPIADFVQAAADDPDVLAIKQTLYRTEPGSVVVEALARAAEQGKQVTAVVELQARFDEERNIAWARRLEEAGVQVVYGLVGLKTHAKVCLIIRREEGQLRRYVHLSTGNYNSRTARLYTDLDLLTCDPAIAEDAAQLLNMITGYSTTTAQELFEEERRRLEWRQLIVSPVDYHRWSIQMIEREIEHARAGIPAQITAKMNSLVESAVIEALYRAADAGVKIDLIVRGICCLVPRDNIRVTSIIDRFLEHTRIMLFENGGDREIYLTSGDWMPRNFFRRIEVTWPVVSPPLKQRIEQILTISLADDAKAWRLQADGSYRRRKRGSEPIRSQQRFIESARADAAATAHQLPKRRKRK